MRHHVDYQNISPVLSEYRPSFINPHDIVGMANVREKSTWACGIVGIMLWKWPVYGNIQHDMDIGPYEQIYVISHHRGVVIIVIIQCCSVNYGWSWDHHNYENAHHIKVGLLNKSNIFETFVFEWCNLKCSVCEYMALIFVSHVDLWIIVNRLSMSILIWLNHIVHMFLCNACPLYQ